MQQNVGKTDKIIRIIVGVIIIGVGLYFKSWWGIVGVVSIITALVGQCGLYRLFGISTCKIK